MNTQLLFTGTKIFRGYKNLCDFLEIEPKKGLAKKQQLEEINLFYDCKQKSQKDYILRCITETKREKRQNKQKAQEALKQQKIQEGSLIIIDGKEIDLAQNKKSYEIVNTALKSYIYERCLTNPTQTVSGFNVYCFYNCLFYNRVLNESYFGEDDLKHLLKKYPISVIANAKQLMLRRLDARVIDTLKKLEQEDIIKSTIYYELSNGEKLSEEEALPYINKALEELHIENTYMVRVLGLEAEYYQKRNKIFQAETHRLLKIKQKKLDIQILKQPNDCELNIMSDWLRDEKLDIFFQILRAKILYDLKNKNYHYNRNDFPIELKRGVKDDIAYQYVGEIVGQYCKYDNRYFYEKNNSINYYRIDEEVETINKETLF